jgi:hypothetical protein
MSNEDETAQRDDEVRVLTQILDALQRLDPQSRQRILETVATFFGLAVGSPTQRRSINQPTGVAPLPGSGSFSEDRALPPKQFLLEKQPRTDVERVACLAYYLTHYRSTPHFKTLDISKLNTEAAQIKFSNAAVAVDNATKLHYLVPAAKGTKQISALGEQFVLALPDREKAKAVMASRPRRRPRKSAAAEAPDTEPEDEHNA